MGAALAPPIKLCGAIGETVRTAALDWSRFRRQLGPGLRFLDRHTAPRSEFGRSRLPDGAVSGLKCPRTDAEADEEHDTQRIRNCRAHPPDPFRSMHHRPKRAEAYRESVIGNFE